MYSSQNGAEQDLDVLSGLPAHETMYSPCPEVYKKRFTMQEDDRCHIVSLDRTKSTITNIAEEELEWLESLQR